MNVTETLSADLKKAMKEKDELTRDVVRMLKADLSKEEVKQGRDLSADEILAVLQRAVKSRRESAEEYDKGGRDVQAAQERAEIAVVERYLPKKWSEEETRAAIDKIVDELGASGPQDLGAVMKALKVHGAAVDMKVASALAKARLSPRAGGNG